MTLTNVAGVFGRTFVDETLRLDWNIIMFAVLLKVLLDNIYMYVFDQKGSILLICFLTMFIFILYLFAYIQMYVFVKIRVYFNNAGFFFYILLILQSIDS